MGNYEKEKIETLQKYYENNEGVSIIGLNDSMGSSILPWQTSLLKILKESLSCEAFKPIIIDAFSLLFNKIEHMEYFLSHNLSTKEIEKLNYYGSIASFEKVGKNFHLGPISKLLSLPIKLHKKSFMNNTKDVNLTDVIKNSKHVVAVLGTRSNDEMRYVGNNPGSIELDYLLRDKTPNYYYTVKRSIDPATLPMIFDRIKRNIEYVLDIKYQGTGDIQICMLSQFIPKSLQKESMIAFQKLILDFNELLKEVCKEYNLHYIDQMKATEQYNTGNLNFHLPKEGMEMAAGNILNCLYENISKKEFPITDISTKAIITNEGAFGVYSDVAKDFNKSKREASQISAETPMEKRHKKRLLEISKEHLIETKVLRKVIKER